jgi:hypothetical protein
MCGAALPTNNAAAPIQEANSSMTSTSTRSASTLTKPKTFKEFLKTRGENTKKNKNPSKKDEMVKVCVKYV